MWVARLWVAIFREDHLVTIGGYVRFGERAVVPLCTHHAFWSMMVVANWYHPFLPYVLSLGSRCYGKVCEVILVLAFLAFAAFAPRT